MVARRGGEKIVVENLCYKYRNSEFELHYINLKIGNEFVLVTGRSGSGKSTLIYCLAGLIPHYIRNGEMKGEVWIDGRKTSETPLEELAKKVGVVLQNPESQIFGMTVEEDLAFGLENLCVPRHQMERKVSEILSFLGLEKFRNMPPEALSGGQKQRLAIGSVLALDPEVIVLDEPLSNLDPWGARLIVSTLEKLKEAGRTVVLVERKIEDVIHLVDRVIALEDGRLIADEPPREFLADRGLVERLGVEIPQAVKLAHHLESSGLKFAEFPITAEELVGELRARGIHRSAKGRAFCEIGEGERFATLLDGGQRIVRGCSARAGPIISARDLWFAYEDGDWVLKGINIDIYPGEIVSILGPNGCGKTTLVKHFNGLLKPARGKVFVKGIDTSKSSTAELSRIVGYVFQNPNYQIFSATVLEEALFGPKNLGIKEPEQVAYSSLRSVGLEGKAGASPFSLSFGERERLAIASVLAMDPEVIILDEPTTGQDRFTTGKIIEIMGEIKRRNKTVILITHDVELVAECSDRVVVMNEGMIEKVGDPYEIFSDEGLLTKLQLPPPNVATIGRALGMNPPPLTICEFMRRLGG